MDLKQASPGVIASHLSALAYKHKVYNMPDHTQTYVVRKMLAGCRKLHPGKGDTRRPINKQMLSVICEALPMIFPKKYTHSLYNAMFCLAFYAFLRVGEYTVSGGQHENMLQLSDVQLVC